MHRLTNGSGELSVVDRVACSRAKRSRLRLAERGKLPVSVVRNRSLLRVIRPRRARDCRGRCAAQLSLSSGDHRPGLYH
jgi:hypothetical protein